MKPKQEIVPVSGAGALAVTPDFEAQIAKAQAEVQAAVVLAKRFPRDEAEVERQTLEIVSDPELADLGGKPRWFYTFPRGRSEVTGLSAPMAREIARLSTNFVSRLRVFPNQDDVRRIEVEVVDLQTNYHVSTQDSFKMALQRKDKKTGVTRWIDVSGDERELRELTNKRAAILERICIFKLRPVGLTDKLLKRARQTYKSLGEKKPIGARREALAESFATKLGVYLAPLEDYCQANFGHSYGETNSDELVELGGIGAAIRDDAAKRDEYFPPKAGEKPLAEDDEAPTNLSDLVGGKVKTEPDKDATEASVPVYPEPAQMKVEIQRALLDRFGGDEAPVKSHLKVKHGVKDLFALTGESLLSLYDQYVREEK